MQTRIQGTTMPVLEVQLDPNESVFSESGELSWLTASIQMSTHTQMGGGGGLFGVLKRVAGGGSIFMTEYRAFQYRDTLCRSRLGRARSSWFTVTGSYAPPRWSQSALDFSSRWARASLAATGSCCSAWPGRELHGLS